MKALKKGFDLIIDELPSDKSLSQRALLFSLLSEEESIIKNCSTCLDAKACLRLVKSFAKVEKIKDDIKISKSIFYKAKKYKSIKNTKKLKNTPLKYFYKHFEKTGLKSYIFDCENSATLMRLSTSLFINQKANIYLQGDASLEKRPMARVIKPLKKMGGKILSSSFKAPLLILPNKGLKGIAYRSKISSAQLKTAFILAALQAKNSSYYSEPELSRNHSEILLLKMGAKIQKFNNTLKISPLKAPLKALNINIAKDPSSAFYLALAAIISKNSKIIIKDILYNKTRLEAFIILQKMGAYLKIIPKNEDLCDIVAKSSQLKALCVDKNIAWLIDELPALSIAFALASGTSVLKNASELRFKESDRIKTIVYNLNKCGVYAKELKDGFIIKGSNPKKAFIKTKKDHRIAMSFLILGLRCGMDIDDYECIKSSFPNFKNILQRLGADFS